jgi:simple sugar transport system ATP-binding protein
MHVNIREIHKSFGSVHANDGVSLDIQPGVIMGVLGENGAGKTTLMKILSGLIEKDSGEIIIDGKPVQINQPADALMFGIGMLHQDPQDFPSMSIREDLQISGIKTRGDARLEWNNLRKWQQDLGFDIELNQEVSELTVGERQQLELLRLLWNGVELLILDEPTTGISASQKDLLFSALRKLAQAGKTIIFVSHKLEEIQSLCHLAAIMRKGKLVDVVKAPFNEEELVFLMFGRNLKRVNPRRSVTNEVCFRVEKLVIEDFRLLLKDINLDLLKGEVVGLAGMEGSGQKQFLQALAGLKPPVSGTISSNSKNLVGSSCFEFQKEGIYFVPSARLEEGLMPGMSLSEHFFLARSDSGFMINRKENENYSLEKIQQFQIKGQPLSRAEELSGGNQQRMLLSLQRDPANVLLLENPTRGLDIESANWIWKLMRARCEKGSAIIFSSADLEELLFYSDRLLVFYGGEVSDPMPCEDIDEARLGAMIGGKEWVA